MSFYFFRFEEIRYIEKMTASSILDYFKYNKERLTVQLGYTTVILQFPIFRQTRPDFFRELTTRRRKRYNSKHQETKEYKITSKKRYNSSNWETKYYKITGKITLQFKYMRKKKNIWDYKHKTNGYHIPSGRFQSKKCSTTR